jgi:hypothetical protein
MTESTSITPGTYTQPRFQISPWRLLVSVSMAAITISWLAPFYDTLTRTGLGASPSKIILSLALIIGLAYVVDLIVDFLKLRPNVRVIAQFGILFVSGVIALKLMVWGTPGYGTDRLNNYLVLPEIVGLMAILLAWWRGQTLSQHQVGTIKIRRAFRYGIWMHLITSFIGYQVYGDLNPVPFYIFLFAGLVGMGSARLATVGSLRGGRGVPFDRGLIAGIGGTAGGLILLSSMVALWAGGPLASLIRRILSGTLSGVVEAIFFLLGPIIRWFINLLEGIVGPDLNIRPEDAAFDPNRMGDTIQQALAELNEEITPPTWAADLGQIVKLALIVIGVMIILVLIYAGLRQWRAMGRLSIRRESESLISLSDLPHLLQDAIRQRIRAMVDGFQRLRPDERRFAATRIRRIYAELMDLSQQLEMERPKAQTPLEFLPSLKALFESEDEALEHITRAYLKVRYGELPETRQQVEQVESAWRKVELRGRFLHRQAHGRLGLS